MAQGAPGKGLICNTKGDRQAYLGHFRSGENLKRGHNFGFSSLNPFGGGSDKPAAPHRPTKKQLGSEQWRGSHKVASAKADVRAAKKAGDEGAIAAAQQAKRSAVGEKKEALKTVRGAAKAVQESKGMGGGVQRTAKRALQTARQTAKQSFKGALQKQDMRRAAKKKSSGGGMLGSLNPF